MSKEDWIKKVGEQLAIVCNGKTTSGENHTVCKMNNGEIKAIVTSDGTRMLIAQKYKKNKMHPRLSMESQSDEMLITRSLSGSIEFLHRSGAKPEVRIEQKGKRLGDIDIVAFNEELETSLYGSF